MKGRVALLCVLASSVAVGCAHWTEVRREPGPLAADVFLPSRSSGSLVLEMVERIRNGRPAEVSPTFQTRFVLAMRRGGPFGRVYEPGAVDAAPPGSARASLRVTEEAGGRLGLAIAKGALIGLSLFTLAPVLPLRFDQTESLQLRVSLPDGQEKVFSVSTSASAYFQLWGDEERALAELDDLVTSMNFEALVARVGADSAIRAFLEGSDPSRSLPADR